MKVFRIRQTTLEALQSKRARYLAELDDYVVYEAALYHDATHHYFLSIDSKDVGYVVFKTDYRIVLEAWLDPTYREEGASAAAEWLLEFGAERIRSKTNDPFLCSLLFDYCQPIKVESLHFQHQHTPQLRVPGAQLRPARVTDLLPMCGILCAPEARELKVDDEAAVRDLVIAGDTYWALEIDQRIVGVGAVWRNNLQEKFVDVGMVVHPDWRRKGMGSLILQEMGKVCESRGLIPRAGCFVDHELSRLTLSRAGFVLSSRMLMGEICHDRLRARREMAEGRFAVEFE
jgi:GNAT superfamily N-acetyltransferase